MRFLESKTRHQVLLQVVRFFGSVQAYSDALGIARSRVSNWINQGNAMPYDQAVVTTALCPISLDDLSPTTKRANTIIKRLRNNQILAPVELAIDRVLREKPSCEVKQNRPIIVDSKGVLIAGLEQLNAHQAAGKQKIMAVILEQY